MARLTPEAAAWFRMIFDEVQFPEAAIRLGSRSGPRGQEKYVDIVELGTAGPEDSVQYSAGVPILLLRADETEYEYTIIDFVPHPAGFVFRTDSHG